MVGSERNSYWSGASRKSRFTHLVCLLATDLFLCPDVYCDNETVVGSTSQPKLKVSCLTYGSGAKGYYIPSTKLLYDCSVFACSGFLGCEECCDDSRSSQIRNDCRSKSDGSKAEVQDHNNVIQLPLSKDPIFLALVAVLAMIFIIAAIAYVGMSYCRIRDQKLKQSDEKYLSESILKKSQSNYVKPDKVKPTWKQKSTRKPCYRVTHLKPKRQCEQVPAIKIKLGGRSCKISPKCAINLPANEDGPAREMTGIDNTH